MRTVNANWLVIQEDMCYHHPQGGVTLSAIPENPSTPFATHEFLADKPDVLYIGHYFADLQEALDDFSSRVRAS